VQHGDGCVVRGGAQPGLRGQLQRAHHEIADHITWGKRNATTRERKRNQDVKNTPFSDVMVQDKEQWLNVLTVAHVDVGEVSVGIFRINFLLFFLLHTIQRALHVTSLRDKHIFGACAVHVVAECSFHLQKKGLIIEICGDNSSKKHT